MSAGDGTPAEALLDLRRPLDVLPRHSKPGGIVRRAVQDSVSGARGTSASEGPALRNRSQRREFRDDAVKTFHQNVLVLNARLVPDRPCLDVLARDIFSEAVRRDLVYPPL